MLGSVPPLAHPGTFGDLHRIESSATLAELTAKQSSKGCCGSPALLIVTNAPCLLAGLLHMAEGRMLPCVIFVCLAVASSLFHLHVDLWLRPSVFWTRTDRSLAYAGMMYHTWLCAHSRTLPALAAGAVCLASVKLYFDAYAAWEQGRLEDYVRLHSLWHVAAGVGTVMFALL